ncbi:hypothetical protein [Aquamicrobium sp. LC103]|uniref:hypothetical protein n=1 Tax=Aquamicrobium sp. LC103 TaxID=1120658 RepID=UPI00063EA09A|nr:hypothetical protein [Aquamicrobium sp. LC103]TKT79966.1 hypothetical protein XW59_006280 [Aquamicrobium sp. LC103]
MVPPVFTLPELGFQQVRFDLIVPENLNRMEGRFTEGQVFGTPYWVTELRYGHLEPLPYGKADAFVRRVTTRGGVFRACDIFRSRPIEHDDGNGTPLSGTRAGGGAFDGTATLQSITNSRTVVVSGLPPLFQFREGDYAEFRRSANVVALHSLEADARASSSGVVTLSLDPAYDAQNFPVSGTTVNFEKASCLMKIEPGSYSGQKSQQDRSPSFSAAEMFFS